MATEVTSAWLQAVRRGQIDWDDYAALKHRFLADIDADLIRLYATDDFDTDVLDLKELNTRMHMESMASRSGIPILHTHDAYYVAVARSIQRSDELNRVVLVTNDARVWKAARALGLSTFHGNTCDLGTGTVHVGSPGTHFPQGANCEPCALATCPSRFALDWASDNLGSGTPQ